MKNLILLMLGCVFSNAVLAISEQDYSQEMQGIVHPFLENEGEVRFFKGVGGQSIAFHTYPKIGNLGALLIVPGRTESFYKWAEVIYDMAQEGFGPIYTLDHRGQGLSGRLANHPQKGHVDKFNDYVADLGNLINSYVVPETKGQDLFLLAHSMGGAISGLFLQNNPSPFKAVAMVTPMFEINLGTYTPLQAESLLNGLCLIGKCKDYAPGKVDFEDNKVYSDADDETSSQVRWDFYRDFVLQHPELKVGGPTAGWVLQSLRATRQLRKNAQKLTLPMLVFGAGLDETVMPAAIEEVCEQAANCQMQMFADGKHGLQNEIDPIRDEVLLETFNFFIKHK